MMIGYIEESIYLCNQIIDLLETDYQDLYNSLKGELYEEYKIMILEEIERVTELREHIKSMMR